MGLRTKWDFATATTSATPNEITPMLPTVTYARKAILRAPSTNTNDVSFGSAGSADFTDLVPGDEYGIETPDGIEFDIAGLYFKSAGASQEIKIMYV